MLRTFTIDDASLLYQLNSDPDVIRFTYDPLHNLSEAHKIIEQIILPQYKLYNHGRWAIHLRNTMEFVGWCGLKYDAERNETDLGYRLAKEHWNKGYATEAATACIQYGFETLGIHKIVGKAVKDNLSSINVLKKCGMFYTGEQNIGGYPMETYAINNPLLRDSDRMNRFPI
ncbi:MAG: GNAT family N-acetyltransferase [Chitinophagaceae bacterium]